MKQDSNHLPIYGPGPVYVAVIIAATVAGIALSACGIIPDARIAGAEMPLRIIGAILVIGGVALWAAANFGARIDEGIVSNTLVTTGVYAIVRNPIYSAFMLVCSGALLVFGNLWLLVLIPVFWVFMTLLMKATEERWLADLYGQEYAAYCARVNRCIPWFPKRR